MILVDDEILIRKLVRMKLDLAGLGVEITGEYATGESALEAVMETGTDLVICDICMPDGDGLTFSEKCIARFPDVRIIVLTGYDNFDYARRGLRAGVCDYLLKPVRSQELNAAVQRAAEQIRKERREKREQEQILGEIRDNLPALLRGYLTDLLQGKVPEGEKAEREAVRRLSSYGMKLCGDGEHTLRMAVLTVSGVPEKADVFRLESVIGAYFKEDEEIYTLRDAWGRYIMICQGAEFPLESCMHLLKQTLLQDESFRAEYGISTAFHSWTQLRQAQMSALEDLRRWKEGQEKAGMPVMAPEEETAWRAAAEKICSGDLGGFVRYLRAAVQKYPGRAGDGEDILACRGAVCDGGAGQSGVDTSAVLVRERLRRLCLELKLGMQAVPDDRFFHICLEMGQPERALAYAALRIAVKKAILEGGEPGRLMQAVLDYMQEHLAEEGLDLGTLTEVFSVSSRTLGRMFRKFTGISYMELLSRMRLARMEVLLHDTQEKDWEIGQKIGIAQPHYLSIWFRKMTGCSVTEYRRRTGVAEK